MVEPEKRRILFVDDEPDLLQGLRRILRPMRHEWEMQFVSNANDALGILEASPFDVLVTDLVMPVMDGVELLENVKARYPQMIRLVLSGHVGKEKMYRVVELAHQFMTKPCDAETLRGVIAQSSALHNLLQSDSLKQVVGELDALPSLPTLYIKIMQELKTPGSSIARIGEIISGDLGMSAKTLQLVNSAFFGLPRKIESVKQATIYLGMETIRSLVLSSQIFSSLQDDQASQFRLNQLWQHSQLCAAVAKALAIMEGLPSEQVNYAYMAGMFHDIGKIILVTNLPKDYMTIIEMCRKEDVGEIEAERLVLSVTHAEIGGYLLGLWGFHDPLVEAVCLHHDPELSPDESFSPLTAVHVANALGGATTVSEAELHDGIISLKYLERINQLHRMPDWQAKFNEISEKGGRNER